MKTLSSLVLITLTVPLLLWWPFGALIGGMLGLSPKKALAFGATPAIRLGAWCAKYNP